MSTPCYYKNPKTLTHQGTHNSLNSGTLELRKFSNLTFGGSLPVPHRYSSKVFFVFISHVLSWTREDCVIYWRFLILSIQMYNWSLHPHINVFRSTGNAHLFSIMCKCVFGLIFFVRFKNRPNFMKNPSLVTKVRPFCSCTLVMWCITNSV